MKTSDFDYELPQELIAQTPVEPRDSSRLLVYHRDTGAVEHKIFRYVIDYLNPGDVLVINQTRVIPARLYGVKEGTGGAIEFLLLRRLNLTDWEVILKPGKKGTGSHLGRRCCRSLWTVDLEIPNCRAAERTVPPVSIMYTASLWARSSMVRSIGFPPILLCAEKLYALESRNMH